MAGVRWFFLTFCLAIVFGCRHWQPDEETPFRMPPVRTKPDSISLEIAIANIDVSRAARLAELWAAIDEQGIPVERRRILDVNGTRCGIAASQMPSVFHELVANDSSKPSPPRLVAHQMIQNGFGDSHPIEVAAMAPELHWSVVQIDRTTRAGSCDNATCLFELRTYPLGNGTAEMELCPKIRHGVPRPKLTTEHNAFTLTPLLDEIPLNELAFGCRLKPGETLIVGPTDPPVGLGRTFLDGTPDGSGTIKLVLIRLARTQMDDLFSPQKLRVPLVTPAQ